MRASTFAYEAIRALEAGIRAATRSSGRERKTRSEPDAGAGSGDDGPAEEPPEERALFISVKPRFASAILEGRKTVELRRSRPNLPEGSLVILYSSTPTRAVVGWAQLTGVREGTPIEIWDEFGAAAAIEELDYDAYFHGTDQAFALELDHVVAATHPIPLSVIRSIGIQPPQSWRYVPAKIKTQIQESALA